jgi:exosortase A-associated hydrolase 1
MTRRHLTFACGDDMLVGTLDIGGATGASGLLLVSGGNELRAGTWAGQAQLAARLAAQGYPVFRFDRRGVGDSEGDNAGFRGNGPDMAAALATFRSIAPHMTRVVAFGNCDAASALALNAGSLALDGLVLANPWTIDGDEAPADAMPAGAIRQRYLAKLKNPREVWRLLTGGVNLRKLAGGLKQAASAQDAPSSLADAMAAGLTAFAGPVTILLASRDRTAQMFEAAWPGHDARVQRIDSASHSFSDETAREWLFARLIAALD